MVNTWTRHVSTNTLDMVVVESGHMQTRHIIKQSSLKTSSFLEAGQCETFA